MKLIIREYLSGLKESGELDWLLPNLLLTMGFEPVSHAQVGVRQFGVDVAAVKKKSNKEKILYLFTIKQGDVNRADWDSNAQSIRPSLNDIRDVYLQKVRPEFKNHKKIIVLCTGGIIKQEVEDNWNGYTRDNTIDNKREYEFWGGDKLALLIEKFLFSENLLPAEFKSLFRRTLSLIGDVDYDLIDYSTILNKSLSDKDFGDVKKSSAKAKIKKSLRTIHLCVNIIWLWSKEENNIKNALIAAEKTSLHVWGFIVKNNLTNSPSIVKIFGVIHQTLYLIYLEYIKKIESRCYIENGLLGNSRYYLLESLNVFEQLGIVSIVGIKYKLIGESSRDDAILKEASTICNLTKEIIKNHQALKSPLYDNHIIEISESILLLAMFSEFDFIENWIKELIQNISIAYNNLNKYFPISSDSFDDLVSLNIKGEKEKGEYITMSTLFPILAQWCCVLNLPSAYKNIRMFVNKVFPKTTLQMWYPDSETDSYIYTGNASIKTGAVDAPMIIPDTIAGMSEMILKVQKNTVKMNTFSSINRGYFELPIISSRHFRTPFLPQFIQYPITSENVKNP